LHHQDILKSLIEFNTISSNPNIELMNHVSELLSAHNIQSALIANGDGTKANLFATIGPENVPGIMLSGHTDVVPVEGQEWSKPAFELTEEDGKLFGRGTADMKGFVACAIATAIKASKLELKTPLHLAFSYDEEIGCVGVHSMIDMLAKAPVSTAMCIVGEPTSMRVAIGHKGKTGAHATCIGKEGHSALAPNALNAIHLGCDFIGALRDIQKDIEDKGVRDNDYDVPYTTVHAGKINGGVALNIVPNLCKIAFEIRNIAEDDPSIILDRIKGEASRIVDIAKQHTEEADIQIEVYNTYPGLNTLPTSKAVEFVKSLLGANDTCKVAFGTEGGLFSQKLDIPTVVCGPGSMDQGHKPDEFISIDQLNQCEQMLDRLIKQLESGL